MKYYEIMILYSLFCVIATALNLLTQRLVLAVLNQTSVVFIVAMLLGTGIGLLVKYALDKNFIFIGSGKIRPDNTQFIMYALTGVGTTTIFWSIETIFWFFGETQLYREIGAVIGLCIGYVAKYKLDKRFVFKSYAIGR